MGSEILHPVQSLNEMKSPATIGAAENEKGIISQNSQKYQICFIQVTVNTADYKMK